MQTTAGMASLVPSTLPAHRPLIRDIDRQMKTHRKSDWIWFVLPVISILTPVVLIAAFMGWFWSGFTLDGPAPEGTDRLFSGLVLGAGCFVSLCASFWFLSVPFFVTIGWAFRNLWIAKRKRKGQLTPSE